MDVWGRDDERTETFDLTRLREPAVKPASSPAPVPLPQRVVEVGPPPSRRDPRRE